MIDVVFLMIVFFLCLDFRICEAKVPAYLPCDRSVGPTKFEPVPQLSVQVRVREQGRRVYPDGGAEGHDPWTGRPRRFTLIGHEVRWEVGNRVLTRLEQLRANLVAICEDRSLWVDDPEHPGRLRPMEVVVQPYPGTCYHDAAITADAARAAGFDRIHFGGGLGALPPRGR